MVKRIVLNLLSILILTITSATPVDNQPTSNICDPSSLNKISNQFTKECVNGCCLIDVDDIDCHKDCYKLTNYNDNQSSEENNDKSVESNTEHKPKEKNHNSDECIEIHSASACAPWQSGYYINKTELSLVYGQKINSEEDWDEYVYSATSGGEYQANLWNDWARCINYNGESIQYSRTYTCLTDIFLFSSGCNKQAPKPSPCPDFCEVYGKAVETLLSDDGACPNVEDVVEDEEEYRIVESRRSILASAALGCKDILHSWSSGKYEGKVSKQGFTSGGYAEDFKENVYFTEATCPKDKFIVGVDEDAHYCGFGGNLDAAEEYCSDFENAPCCKNLKNTSSKSSSEKTEEEDEKKQENNGNKQKNLKLSQGAEKVQELNSENLSSDQQNGQPASSNSGGDNTGAIVAGTLGSVGMVGLIIGATLVVRRKKSSSAGSGYQSPTKVGMTSSKKPKTILNERFPVVHEYHQSLPDEVELRKGDIVELISSYDDGWAKGRNITTGLEGTFPLACLKKKGKK
ncbi:hypothetical protein HK099_006821 [Clydaea vesicula]|uniref:SH3 domain-containing protein n=1 Tax=Clydaea vesicula TaxID=447962 RepID=A0AAD5XYW1_9FUNG|nr:hypothetical protein HK099_006821 [Clydaea vesicula]KAJ3394496.1 hypothetical protein HDU92_006882 [Lobulomyces angularis]